MRSRRAAYGCDALREAGSVGQVDVNDGNAHRQELGEPLVAHEV